MCTHGSLGPLEPTPKRLLDRFSRFCRVHCCDQHRHTDHATRVAIGRISRYAMRCGLATTMKNDMRETICESRPNWVSQFHIHFYRAMLCIRGTRHGPVSVCLCLSVCLSQVGVLLKRLTPHDSPGTLVLRCQRSPRNSTGVTPYEGAECRWGGSKSATFDK